MATRITRTLRIALVCLMSILLISGVSVFASDAASDSAVSSKETAKEAINALKGLLKNSTFGDGSDNFNILLAGVDRRDTSWNGNSDSMILISINQSTRNIHMMSFMRDLYADIDGYGTRKLNSACAIGGPEFMVSMIEKNYGVSINNYVCVDFASMAKIIDALGGVTITVSDREAELANGLISDMSTYIHDLSSYRTFDQGAGTYECDGIMTVAYSRIRHVGNSDYQRTQRQRDVLENIMDRVKAMDTEELTKFTAKALTYVSHNMSAAQIASLATMGQDFLTYTVDESRVPFDDMYSTSNEILMPVQPDTNNKIQEILAS